MTPASNASMANLMAQRDRWLVEQIRQLSVDAIGQGTFTCTECGEVSGEYIIQRGEETQRLSAAEAYAFLQFALSAK